MRALWFLFCAALLVGLAVGCTGGKKKPVKVEGSVLVDGQPMAGVDVTLSPIDGNGMAAQGRTDVKGNFSLSTFNPDDGAIPGSYKILVAKARDATQGGPPSGGAVTDPKELAELMRKFKEEGAKKEKPPIAPDYGDPGKTTLKCTVPVDGPLVLKVSSK
jgi:hypothetical protein